MTILPNSYALTSFQLIVDNSILHNSFIKWMDGRIIEYGPMESYHNLQGLPEIKCQNNLIAAPGFIDIHIHGSHGADVMDSTIPSLQTMASSLLREGTTSFLATTMTSSVANIKKALQNVFEFKEEQENYPPASQVLGVHLEGPFINPKRAGAQPLTFIQEPSVNTFQALQQASGGIIKVATIAPEMPHGCELVESLSQTGVIPSVGHSDAVYEEMLLALGAGAQHITHLYNGMRVSHHREPGVSGAGLAHPDFKVEIIPDGIHVHPAVVKATYLAKGAENILLITDSMRAKGLSDGDYELGGQKVTVQKDNALLEDGTLAGSVLRMNDAVKNMMKFTGCSLPQAIQMASTNQAKQLSIADKKGSIGLGRDADIVILDEKLRVKMTFCHGQLAYKGD